jgi:SAM-dependent methyltransferase
VTDPEDGGTGQSEQVRRFYQRNADRFERFGQGGTSLHRAVWAPGVTSRRAAFHHVDELVLRAVPPVQHPLVVDLGCGVGASLLYLAARLDLRGEGITISANQVARATALIAAAGAGDRAGAGARARVRCRQGDFLHPPADLRGADLAFSIEAFVHGSDPAAYFRAAADLLRPGGTLVICDDFLARSDPLSPRHARWLQDFRLGWRVGSLITAECGRELARDAGFSPVEDLDLTPYLELRRPRDRAVGLLMALTRPMPIAGEYWRSLAGGDALQHALGSGALHYRFLRFERSPGG